MGRVPFPLCLSISGDLIRSPPGPGAGSVLPSSPGQPRIHLADTLLRLSARRCGPGEWLSVGRCCPVPGCSASCHPPEPQRVGVALPEPPRSEWHLMDTAHRGDFRGPCGAGGVRRTRETGGSRRAGHGLAADTPEPAEDGARVPSLAGGTGSRRLCPARATPGGASACAVTRL